MLEFPKPGCKDVGAERPETGNFPVSWDEMQTVEREASISASSGVRGSCRRMQNSRMQMLGENCIPLEFRPLGFAQGLDGTVWVLMDASMNPSSEAQVSSLTNKFCKAMEN